MPKKELVEVLLIMAALVEQTSGHRSTNNKYLAICKNTDGFSEAIWTNAWRLLKGDL
jgi:hypothetical protein